MIYNKISDKHCYIPDWTTEGFTSSFMVKVLKKESCLARVDKTEFKISPHLRNIICVNWWSWIKCKITFDILSLPRKVVCQFNQDAIFQISKPVYKC